MCQLTIWFKGEVMLDREIQSKRKLIEEIYKNHGFTVRYWIQGLECRIGEACHLHDESDQVVEEHREAAWREIDRVIHGVIE